MSRRLSDSSGLKGVTTLRNGSTYFVNLPKFTPLPNANSITISAEKVHEEFRKLTPKQRIAVLTIKDPIIATKMYRLSNSLWAKSLQEMRNTVGNKSPDDDGHIRQFINNFEFFFGAGDSDSEALTEDEDGEKKPLLNRRKKESSSIASSVSRPMNSTFTYTSADPSVFRPKLNFMTTRDVVAFMMKNSKDFLGSQARARCRILQRPEMWAKIVESSRNDEEPCSADYEAIILQLMEFRLMFEYLNGGSGGEPFSAIRKAYPSSEELWAKKDKQLKKMEDGLGESTQETLSTEATNTEQQTTPTALVSQPKRTKKQKMMEKIAAQQAAAAAVASSAPLNRESPDVSDSSSDDDSEDADALVINHRRKRFGSTDSSHLVIPPVKVEQPVFAAHAEEEPHEESDWIQVGATGTAGAPPRTRKGSADTIGRNRISSSSLATKKVVPAPSVHHEKRKPLRQLSAAHKTHKFRLWVQSRPGSEYVCDSLSVKAVPKGTFIHVVSTDSGYLRPQVPIKECPF